LQSGVSGDDEGYFAAHPGQTLGRLQDWHHFQRCHHGQGLDYMTKILAVDNNRTVLKTISRQLEHLKYDVLTATNEEEAMAVYLRERPIDLVLIDVVLSDDTSGHDLADAMLERDPAQKVLLMSGY